MGRELGSALLWALAKAQRRKDFSTVSSDPPTSLRLCVSALSDLSDPPRTPEPTASGDLCGFAGEARPTHFVPLRPAWLTLPSLGNTFAATHEGRVMVTAIRGQGRHVDPQRVKRRDDPSRACNGGEPTCQTPRPLAAFAAKGRPAYPRHGKSTSDGVLPLCQRVAPKSSTHPSGDRPTDPAAFAGKYGTT